MSNNRLSGKWILITGATSGIGKATAYQFAGEGANLYLTGRREDRLISIRDDIQSKFSVEIEIYSFDIRDREACKSCVESIEGPIDILVNNAGLASGKDPVDQADFEDWDKMIDTNVKGLLSMTRFVSERMKKSNEGHIINVGSIAGHEAYAGGSVYCGTKHAVKAITQATKMDLHGTGIRVSAVSPGLVETEFSEVRFHGDKEAADSVYSDINPLTADDIAEIIIFMASRPPHVNIMDTIVLPTDQSSSTMVHRSSKK
ncbi:SDR family NAD(P)-dependent oxidoreductase [Rhodohalobacter barkolensis]|uniref:NAD(P)-dependent oxidoreductase n=1 Tax=Rhodohalobacter barkolensis TaxID=2053187 RepID=A0A2N0VJQ3_9BACT|nr:SDR family NAD(P)-dependent oxidoreductase [Rhodohalobacter barkolensis]PKD44409.1 NAD(P)-dependent oxidoreductase [Rhodohalobacter barkolensis]